MTLNHLPLPSENCTIHHRDHSAANEMPSGSRMPLTEDLATLGHEIRNPLSALSYSLQAWPEGTDDPHLTQHLLQIMRRHVSQLTRLCNDMLDTGRIARGSLTIREAAVDLAQVIQNACEEIQPFIEECGHTLTVSLGNSSVSTVGDESRLTQVIANLIHNSAKFTDRNGLLSISLEKDEGMAVIRLCDNGTGICADQLRTLFKPNTSLPANSCSTAVVDGLGIGLRLVKSIVDLHGGTIEISSQGLGHGSTCVVRLPLSPAVPLDSFNEPAASPTNGRPANVDADLQHYRVVVVDDDRTIRFLMTRLLRLLGQTVSEADNGDTAIATVIKVQPHVLFLDLEMRGMSGFEVARELRKHVELDSMVIVAVSANSDAASRRRATDSGFDRYLVKPTSVAELKEILLRVGEDEAARCAASAGKQDDQ